MKNTSKLQASIFALSSIAAIALFAILVLAPSVFWTSNSDWSGGTFSNTTSINGDLQLDPWNNTRVFTNWTYRKAIIVNGSTSNLSDYQIPINLTTAIYNNTGLVGSWHFTNNDTSDSSGYGNNGVQNGGVNCSATGKFGTGCGFDGTAEF